VVHQASNIKETALFAAQDPYIEVSVMMGRNSVCKARTRANKSGGRNPVWTLDLDNQITLEIDKAVLDATAASAGAGPILVFRVLTENMLMADGLIGSVQLPLRTLRDPGRSGQRNAFQLDTGGKLELTAFLPTYVTDVRNRSGGRHAARRIEHSSLVASPKAQGIDPFTDITPPPPPGQATDAQEGDEDWLENKRVYASVCVPPEGSRLRRDFLMNPLPQTWEDDGDRDGNDRSESDPRARKMVECEITISSRCAALQHLGGFSLCIQLLSAHPLSDLPMVLPMLTRFGSALVLAGARMMLTTWWQAWSRPRAATEPLHPRIEVAEGDNF
jgi:hypothetical protein